MMKSINLGVVSQTPAMVLAKKYRAESVRLQDINEGDYSYNIGGVAPMLRTQLEELRKKRWIKEATWFSLNPTAPKNIVLYDGIKLVSIYIDKDNVEGYTGFKEKVWNNIHDVSAQDFTTKEYLGYFRYNSRLAREMLTDYGNIDLFEIDDFQQMLLGAMLGPSVPTVLRWHIPFIPERLSKKIRKFVVNGLEGNDAVIISTNRGLEGLIRAGYKGSAYQIYPHIDPARWERPGGGKVDAFSERHGLRREDFVVLCVGRMDEIKSQDDLIRAMAVLKERRIKLVLVGGGSFTSKVLGHSKAEIWAAKLKELAKKLRVEERVIFTDSLSHEDLECAYTRADLLALPSHSEGFGLVVVEGWLYNTPAIVSEGAGVSELITNEFNGFTFKPGDCNELARLIFKTYKNGGLRDEMARTAHSMAKMCYISTAIEKIKNVYERTMADFG